MSTSLSPTRPAAATLPLRYRLAVASRVLAALLGGYYLAYASTALLTVILPMDRLSRAMTASLLSFAVWCAAAIWVFAARSAWRSWWPLLAGASVLLGLALLGRGYGARA